MTKQAEFHENFRSRDEVKVGSERAFGLVFSVLFAAIALWPVIEDGPVRGWAAIVAGLFLTVAMAAPQVLRQPNLIWFKFGLLLNKITSPLLMGLLFYGLITPYGYVLRWLGKDTLRLRLDPSADTYWIERKPPGPAPETIKRQF